MLACVAVTMATLAIHDAQAETHVKVTGTWPAGGAGAAFDSASHKPWPFAIIMAGGVSFLTMRVLAIARKLAGPGRTA